MCGVISFIANLLVFYAAEMASRNNQNVGIVTALTNGAVLFALFGSYFVYKENINKY